MKIIPISSYQLPTKGLASVSKKAAIAGLLAASAFVGSGALISQNSTSFSPYDYEPYSAKELIIKEKSPLEKFTEMVKNSMVDSYEFVQDAYKDVSRFVSQMDSTQWIFTGIIGSLLAMAGIALKNNNIYDLLDNPEIENILKCAMKEEFSDLSKNELIQLQKALHDDPENTVNKLMGEKVDAEFQKKLYSMISSTIQRLIDKNELLNEKFHARNLKEKRKENRRKYVV